MPDPSPISSAFRVLVVDDSQPVRDIVVQILVSGGYSVCAAASGEEALKILAAEPVHLIVSDLHLGEGIRGGELIADATGLQPALKVILITGSLMQGRHRKSPWPILTKPFDAAALLEMAAGLLTRR